MQRTGQPVVFDERHVTGLQIKTTAIAQGVAIQPDFVLYEVGPHGQLRPVGDADTVTLHERQQFRATAPDDNS